MLDIKIIYHSLVIFLIALAFSPKSFTIAQTSTQDTYPQYPTPPEYISVKLEKWFGELDRPPGDIITIPLEEYVYGVVMGELGPVVPNGDYAGQAWDDDVIKA